MAAFFVPPAFGVFVCKVWVHLIYIGHLGMCYPANWPKSGVDGVAMRIIMVCPFPFSEGLGQGRIGRKGCKFILYVRVVHRQMLFYLLA